MRTEWKAVKSFAEDFVKPEYREVYSRERGLPPLMEVLDDPFLQATGWCFRSAIPQGECMLLLFSREVS